MAPSDLAIYRSPRRNARLAAAFAIAACGAIPFMLAHYAVVQTIGAIWLGLCAHLVVAMVERAIDRRAVVRIDRHGILDTRVLRRPIEWWEVAALCPLDLDHSGVVELTLRHPQRTLANAPWHVRLGLGWHRQLDLPDVCINLTMLDGSARDVVAAIRRYAPHLVPRTVVSAQPASRPAEAPIRSRSARR